MTDVIEQHRVRVATFDERKQDCCGDRYPCYVDYICTCGVKKCTSCMKSHCFMLHRETGT